MYELLIIQDNPAAAWGLNDSFVDISGHSNDAVELGSTAAYPALVAGEGGARIVSDTGQIEYPNNVFTNDRGIKGFSLEAWVKPIAAGSPVSILGHDQNSGLVLNGNQIEFLVPFVNETVSVSHLFLASEAYHCVAVFDGVSLELYINSELVDNVDVSEETLQSGFSIFPNDELYSGVSVATGDFFVIDIPAIYPRVLNGDQIARHFRFGRDITTFENVIANRGGVYHSFTDESANVLMQFEYSVQSDWEDSTREFVSISDEGVQPAYEQDDEDDTYTSLPGYVEVSFPLNEDDTVFAAKIDWIGSGDFTVETSTDHDIWTAAANHSLVSGVENWTIIDETFFVRISFDGGILDDESIVNFLRVTIYSDNAVESNGSLRPAELEHGVVLSDQENEPIEYNDNSGAWINGSSIVIAADEQIADSPAINSNASFEHEDDVEDLIIDGATAEQSDGYANSGEYSALITPDASGAVEVGFLSLVEESGGYDMNAFVLSPSGYDSVFVQITWQDTNALDISSDSSTPVILAADTWTEFSISGIAPVGATQAKFTVGMTGTPLESDIIYIDDLEISDTEVDAAADNQLINAIDLWVKFNQLAGAFYLIDTRDAVNTGYPRIFWDGVNMNQSGADKVYVNGSFVSDLTTETFEINHWYHIILTYSATFNPIITIGREYNGSSDSDANFQLGQLSMFEDFPIIIGTPDSSGLELLNEYMGIADARIIDSNVVNFAEPVDNSRFYAHDWSISASD